MILRGGRRVFIVMTVLERNLVLELKQVISTSRNSTNDTVAHERDVQNLMTKRSFYAPLAPNFNVQAFTFRPLFTKIVLDIQILPVIAQKGHLHECFLNGDVTTSTCVCHAHRAVIRLRIIRCCSGHLKIHLTQTYHRRGFVALAGFSSALLVNDFDGGHDVRQEGLVDRLFLGGRLYQ